MKENRQARILEIINQHKIETQEDLLSCLKIEGYSVTQATVSRDIRELKLVKSMSEEGIYCYSIPKSDIQSEKNLYNNALSSSVVSIDYAMNNVVIKTYIGMAQTVAVAIDSMKEESILGCVAGDDTIIIVTKNEESSKSLSALLKMNSKL